MSFFHLNTLGLSDLIFLIPMALAGLVLSSAVPVHTRAAHYSIEIGGAVLGVVAAIVLLGVLQVLF